MTDIRKAAQAALEALIVGDRLSMHIGGDDEWRTIAWPAIDALRAALKAQGAEPVAYMYDLAQWNEGDLRGRGWMPKITRHLEGHSAMRRNVVPLYAAPPQPREPERLTKRQVDALIDESRQAEDGPTQLVLRVESAVLRAQERKA